MSHFRYKLENSITNQKYITNADISVISVSPYAGIELSSERKLANQQRCKIANGKYGKPFLTDGSFSFSLSHSSRVYLLAASINNIGIDIEMYKDRNFDRIVDRWFCNDEKEYYNIAEDKKNAFYEIWVRKEAYSKYTGRGFSSIGKIETVKGGILLERMSGGKFIDLDKMVKRLLKPEEKFKAVAYISI